MPKKYFQSIIEAMKASGFDFMAWITMNSHKNQYHVDSLFTQESYLFFSGPNALIVQLIFHEHFDDSIIREYCSIEDGISRKYWSIKVYYSWSHSKWIEDENNWSDPYHELIEFPYTKILEFFTSDELFRSSGGSSEGRCICDEFEQTGITSAPMDAETLVAPLKQLLELIDPYLYKKFKSLQVTGFAPHYTFPGQETDFWGKFPLKRLCRKVDRVWGK